MLGKPLHRPLVGYRSYRVGDWRIVYEIVDRIITIVVVGPQREIYETIHKLLGQHHITQANITNLLVKPTSDRKHAKMDSNPKFAVRTMTRPEVDLAVEWAAKEGWNPGLHDAETFYQTDPNGFFLGTLNGVPIGCVSTVAYDNTYGFLGFYIVQPEFRGKGYGLQIWNHGMQYLGNRNIGLDGVVDQQPNYKKSGFKLAYRNVRYEGIAKKWLPNHYETTDLTNIPFETILAYDNVLFPVPRPRFLKKWIRQKGSHSLGVFKEGALRGYGVIRTCRKGFKVGPLFAGNEEIAESLFHALTSKVAGNPVYLDVPELNEAAVALAKNHNMNSIFETARMYTKEEPDLPLSQTFGVTTFELG